MGQKDLSEKILEDYNDVFADIINGLIFRGEQRINPDDISKRKKSLKIKDFKLMTGVGPVTSSLPMKCSTTEPHQHLAAHHCQLI